MLLSKAQFDKTRAQQLEIQQVLNECKEFMDDNSHCDRYDTYLAVNIKDYGRNVYVEDVIAKTLTEYIISHPEATPHNTEMHDALVKEFNDARCDQIWWDAANWMVEDWRDNVACGEHKGDKETTTRFKAYIGSKNICQFGRSGGWLGFAKYRDIEIQIEEIEYELSQLPSDWEEGYKTVRNSWSERIEELHEVCDSIACIYESELPDLKEQFDTYREFVGVVSREKKYFPDNYEAELAFRIEEECEFILDEILRKESLACKLDASDLDAETKQQLLTIIG